MHVLFAIGSVFFASADELSGEEAIERMQHCMPFDACFQILVDGVGDYGPIPYHASSDEIAEILHARFGDEAKSDLLTLAQEDDAAARRLATTLLVDWDDWSEDDLPVLATILKSYPDSGVAWIIADIGTDEAIEVLVEYVLTPESRVVSTYFALVELGPRILPFLMPLLTEDQSWDENRQLTRPGYLIAVDLIKQFGARATEAGAAWTEIALDRRESVQRRVGALRGLSALGGYGEAYIGDIRRLKNVRDKKLASQVFETRVDLRDPQVAGVFAQSCQPTAERWDRYPIDGVGCLERLAKFGRNGQVAGKFVYAFLDSPNRAERLLGIEVLGLIGDKNAIPLIEEFLASKDWEELFFAIRALGQLSSRGSLVKIEEATANHWLHELQQIGRTMSLVVANGQAYSGYNDLAEYHFQAPRQLLSNGWLWDLEYETCESDIYSFESGKVHPEDGIYGAKELRFQDGKLIGADSGEFGGEYSWVPSDGDARVLVADNTDGLWRVGNGVVAIHGVRHMMTSFGYATYTEQDDNGNWSVKEIARFPGAVRDVRQLTESQFVASWSSRAFLFNRDGISEAGGCLP